MEPKLTCSVNEDTHETRIEIIEDGAHHAAVILDAHDVETLIKNLAECRAENPEPIEQEAGAEATVIDGECAVVGLTELGAGRTG